MSNLIERFRNVSNGSGTDPAATINLSSDDADSLERYFIPDLPIQETDICSVKVVLLVESPHTSEICHRHPLAGSSGRAITKFLGEINRETFDKESEGAIGCLVKSRCVPWLALVNVSNMPLQSIVYCAIQASCSNNLCSLLESFQNIKKEMERKTIRSLGSLDEREKYVYRIIVNDLACRIMKVRLHGNPLFVPCGYFARNSLGFAFSRLAQVLINVRICTTQNVLHPAKWNSMPQDTRQQMAKEINAEISGSNT